MACGVEVVERWHEVAMTWRRRGIDKRAAHGSQRLADHSGDDGACGVVKHVEETTIMMTRARGPILVGDDQWRAQGNGVGSALVARLFWRRSGEGERSMG